MSHVHRWQPGPLVTLRPAYTRNGIVLVCACGAVAVIFLPEPSRVPSATPREADRG